MSKLHYSIFAHNAYHNLDITTEGGTQVGNPFHSMSESVGLASILNSEDELYKTYIGLSENDHYIDDFYAEVYIDNGKLVIAYRGADLSAQMLLT